MEIIFTVLMFLVFGKLLIFALKAAWGIARILMTVVLLPLVLIGLALAGLFTIAFPALIVIGIIALICK